MVITLHEQLWPCKNQFWNWFLKAKNPVCRTWFLQLERSPKNVNQKSSPKKFIKTVQPRISPQKVTTKGHTKSSLKKFTQKVHLQSSPNRSSKKFFQNNHPKRSPKKFTNKVHQESSPKKIRSLRKLKKIRCVTGPISVPRSSVPQASWGQA